MTAIALKPMVVLQVKTVAKDQVAAVKLGVLKKGADSIAKLDLNKMKPSEQREHFAYIKQINVESDAVATSYTVGQFVTLDQEGFVQGSSISVSGISKGLGFQGVIRRHGFAGGPMSHGSNFRRAPGSSGAMRSSGKIIKGKKFPGHMGVDRITVKNLKLVLMDIEKGFIFVKGAVPGKKNNLILMKA